MAFKALSCFWPFLTLSYYLCGGAVLFRCAWLYFLALRIPSSKRWSASRMTPCSIARLRPLSYNTDIRSGHFDDDARYRLARSPASAGFASRLPLRRGFWLRESSCALFDAAFRRTDRHSGPGGGARIFFSCIPAADGIF